MSAALLRGLVVRGRAAAGVWAAARGAASSSAAQASAAARVVSGAKVEVKVEDEVGAGGAAAGAAPAAAASTSLCSGTVGQLLAQKAEAGRGKWLFVKEDQTVLEAVKKMTSNNVGSLVVVNCEHTLRGIVTERDYLSKIVVQGRQSSETKVGEIMTGTNKLVTVEEETEVEEAMRIMSANRFRHLPVIKKGAWADGHIWKDELLGMMSIGDCVFNLVEQLGEQVALMEEKLGMGPVGGGNGAGSLATSTVGMMLNRKLESGRGKWLYIKEDDTVLAAVQKMTEANVGSLVVMNSDQELRGIVTERDYLHKIIVQGRTSRDTKVGEIMTGTNKLVTVTPDTQLYEAMKVMTAHRFRHMPVVKEGAWEDGKIAKDELAGMVSIGDCVYTVVDEIEEHVKAMEMYLGGGY